MNFVIADTFTDSLARLTGEDQKLVKTTAFDLQLNPSSPGLSFHRLDKGRDKSFWSVRVGSDLRLIVHRTPASLLLCYVGHHDAAYRWAERRKLEAHPTTGAAQLVEVRERIEEIAVRRYVELEPPAPVKPAAASSRPSPPIFASTPEADLLRFGVPPEWLPEVRLATEDTLLQLADHLPREAAEALLDLATGVTPSVALPVPAGTDPFEHPDAQRRFRVVTNVEELERALDYPWEKWTIFLHPAQRQAVERDHSGPARVSGSAGTGKTIVALHRAVFLTRSHPEARTLLTTFSDTLANALRPKLRHLIGNQPRIGERLDVYALDAIAMRLYQGAFARPEIAPPRVVRGALEKAAASVEGHTYKIQFLTTEWEDVVDAWQLETWEEYRDVARLGRKTRLREQQREILWAIFERARGLAQPRPLDFRSDVQPAGRSFCNARAAPVRLRDRG